MEWYIILIIITDKYDGIGGWTVYGAGPISSSGSPLTFSLIEIDNILFGTC